MNASQLVNAVARRAQKSSEDWAARFWHDFPFGRKPRASRETYMDLWMREKRSLYPVIDEFEKTLGFAVDPEWFQNLALHTQVVIKDSVLCYQHGRVLYAALRAFLKNRKEKTALTIIETGTARGFSSVVMARALADAGRPGQIITFDLLPHDIPMYWNCIDDLEGAQSRRQLLDRWRDLVDDYIVFVEGDSRIMLKKIATGRVGFAFLDGAHTYEDVMLEFGTVAARQKPGDVIVFDDYSPGLFPGLVEAVDEGAAKWNYSREILTAGSERAYVIARRQG